MMSLQDKTKEEVEKNVRRLVKKEERLRQTLADAGIDFEFPGYVCLFCFHTIIRLQAGTLKAKEAHVKSTAAASSAQVKKTKKRSMEATAKAAKKTKITAA
jgi:hypothetical protein